MPKDIEATDNPGSFLIEGHRLILFDNVRQIIKDDKEFYMYDQYETFLTPRPGIKKSIEDNPESWLRQAKNEEIVFLSARARIERDQLLADTDWLVIKTREHNQSLPAAWKNYRNELRDIPEQTGFPYDIAWPEMPN